MTTLVVELDPNQNPYFPGAGIRPRALVGRETEAQAWQVALDRTICGQPDRGMVLHGLRGVGKTVLLREMRETAEARGWSVVALEAESSTGSFRGDLSRAILPLVRQVAKPSPMGTLKRLLQTFKAFNIKLDVNGSLTLGMDVESDLSRANTGDLETDTREVLVDLCTLLAERSSGLVLFVDELQELDGASLGSIASVSHFAGQNSLRFLLAGAGLPNLPGNFANAKPYSERLFAFYHIDRLRPEAAREALSKPAAEQGGTWDPQALRWAASQADGFPYFLQEFGSECWKCASGRTISQEAARAGVEEGFNRLDQGFFRSRWDRAKPGERAYMEAMAEVGGSHMSTQAVAARMGRENRSLKTIRSAVIHKGWYFHPRLAELLLRFRACQHSSCDRNDIELSASLQPLYKGLIFSGTLRLKWSRARAGVSHCEPMS